MSLSNKNRELTTRLAEYKQKREEQKAARAEKRNTAKYAKEVKALKEQKPVRHMFINIEWYKNRTWGMCPKLKAYVDYHDGTHDTFEVGRITGCGYDKESTALAELFNQTLAYKLYMVDSIEGHPYGITKYTYYGSEVRRFEGGVGTSCYYPISKYIGGTLEHAHESSISDTFIYNDDPNAVVGAVVVEPPSPFGNLLGVMKMIEVMADTPEHAADGKARILSAGTGLELPTGWNSLSLEERQRRLALVEKELA